MVVYTLQLYCLLTSHCMKYFHVFFFGFVSAEKGRRTGKDSYLVSVRIYVVQEHQKIKNCMKNNFNNNDSF